MHVSVGVDRPRWVGWGLLFGSCGVLKCLFTWFDVFLSVSINMRRDASRGRSGLVTVRFKRILMYLFYWNDKAVIIAVIMRGGVDRKEGTWRGRAGLVTVRFMRF